MIGLTKTGAADGSTRPPGSGTAAMPESAVRQTHRGWLWRPLAVQTPRYRFTSAAVRSCAAFIERVSRDKTPSRSSMMWWRGRLTVASASGQVDWEIQMSMISLVDDALVSDSFARCCFREHIKQVCS